VGGSFKNTPYLLEQLNFASNKYFDYKDGWTKRAALAELT